MKKLLVGNFSKRFRPAQGRMDGSLAHAPPLPPQAFRRHGMNWHVRLVKLGRDALLGAPGVLIPLARPQGARRQQCKIFVSCIIGV